MDKVLANIGIDRHAQASGSGSSHGSGGVRGILNMDSKEAKVKVVEIKKFALLAKDGAVKVKGFVGVVRGK